MKDLKKTLFEAAEESNSDHLVGIVEGIKSGAVDILEKDTDKFEFGCNACGECCFDMDIILHPDEILNIRDSKFVQETLEMRRTSDLVDAGFLNFSIGPDSGMPIATIKFQRVTAGMTKCPFLLPAMGVELKDGIPVPTPLLTDEGNPKLMCAVHGSHPNVCRSYPLGVIGDAENPDGYLLQKTCGCSSKKNSETKKWSVRDWFKEQESGRDGWLYGILKQIRDHKLHESGNPILAFLVLLLYNPDKLGVTKHPITITEHRAFVEEVMGELVQVEPEKLGEMIAKIVMKGKE